VVGAWDDRPDLTSPGGHRAFVLVVDPAISSPDLEALLRDIADRNRGAAVLDVRVYDSAPAADPARGGAGAGAGRPVAELKRHDALGFELMEVRGEPIER
jgi:hypothetical protein